MGAFIPDKSSFFKEDKPLNTFSSKLDNELLASFNDTSFEPHLWKNSEGIPDI